MDKKAELMNLLLNLSKASRRELLALLESLTPCDEPMARRKELRVFKRRKYRG